MCRKAGNLFDFTKIHLENQTKKALNFQGLLNILCLGCDYFLSLIAAGLPASRG